MWAVSHRPPSVNDGIRLSAYACTLAGAFHLLCLPLSLGSLLGKAEVSFLFPRASLNAFVLMLSSGRTFLSTLSGPVATDSLPLIF